ncbi:MAG: metallophosphoesterase [Nocardioidaceae bacterium]
MRALAGAAALLMSAACSGGNAGTSASVPSRESPPHAFEAMSGVRVAAAGDIACAPGEKVSATTCRAADTARLVRQFRPRYVLALGDIQYDDGRLADMRTAYATTWGRFTSRTRPVPGNHDYHQDRAAGYLAYFQQQTGGRSYYAFDVGRWRFYALDSNCSDMDCDTEAAWLEEDMAANPRACTAIAMHHPRYSSGAEHGDSTSVRALWAVALDHHVDLALAGHDHDYERFVAMDADGHVTPSGLVSFVVGTGGKSLYDEGRRHEGSVVFYNDRAGVLDLKLGADSYGWRFRSVDGTRVDSGVRRCR